MTNTHLSCSGEEESDSIPNAFKKAMDLPKAARLKAASDKEIANLDKHGVFEMVLIISVPARHEVFGCLAGSTDFAITYK